MNYFQSTLISATATLPGVSAYRREGFAVAAKEVRAAERRRRSSRARSSLATPDSTDPPDRTASNCEAWASRSRDNSQNRARRATATRMSRSSATWRMLECSNTSLWTASCTSRSREGTIFVASTKESASAHLQQASTD